MSDPSETDRQKRLAGEAAAALVENDMIVGLGTGSTAAFALEALGRRRKQGLRFAGIPTSERTTALATALEIPLTSFAAHPRLDMTIDGADEVEQGTLHLIKGHGGALLREKIVASASDRLIIIADGSKLVDRLGSRFAVPVEVANFGIEPTQAALERLGAKVALRVDNTGRPFVSDGGNRILDCDFGPIADPAELERRIGAIVGVFESGLFVSRASLVLLADSGGVQRLEPTGRE